MPDIARQPRREGVLHELRSRRQPDQVYYLYIPRRYDGRAPARLLVTMHGRDREASHRAERFLAFAERHNYILLGPRFPASIRFQVLGMGGDRADVRLLNLIEEVAGDLNIEADRFDLIGYSGGAQFAHRFLYVWPERLRSVVIGAPGTVTLPSSRERWPVGIRNLARLAGVRFDLEAVRRPRVMLIVGTDDINLDGLNQSPWAMRAGSTRLGRARSLHAAWLVAGITHEYIEVSESAHGLDDQIVERVADFLVASST
jgi:poly(3-hydroxybutyrate) depolymerase